MKRIIILVFSFLANIAFAQTHLQSKIDSLLNLKQPRSFNGVVSVSQNGKTVYQKAVGIAKSKNYELLKPNSKFVLLSNSKQITAVLVLREVDKGRIDLEKNIKTYLPNYPQKWADSVSVHQLLNHTSGIGNFEKQLATKPGTTFKYTDLNYILLGKIVESVSRNTYEKAVNDLFMVSGMKNSGYPNRLIQNELVSGFHFSENKEEITKYIIPKDRIPAAGLISTVADLAIWNEKLHDGKLLKPETYQKMISYNILSQHNVFGEKAIGYGYGIRVNDKSEITEFGHTGIVPEQGFTSVNLYYPKTKTSIIVLENQCFDDFSISYFFEAGVRKIVLESGILK
ncbi:serine hydrolase domain-containing protein [Lacihabitans sp. CCS-44]|uniref:serine hydrolase domain-containing protein n=1 Tax=Lacihabitans sp. CCS-44 TaxID=2487331 RepID=UPI0020CFCD1E|nr:serine hydrolase domain-containing protein [Lacihabitans sp. CCS-44]